MARSLQHSLRLCRAGLLTVACILSLIPTANAQLGRPEGLYYKSWAVVIGINDYLVAPKLDGAVEEGKAVADAFRKLGFQDVLEVYNKDASSKRMHFILNEYLPRKVGRQDRVVIFFVGHAGASQDMHNKDIGYLVPWDAQVSNVSKAVTLDHLKEFSRRVMAKHVLFVLDAAVSGWDITPPQALSLEGRLSPEEVRSAVAFLSGRPFPASDPRVLEVSWATLSELLQALGPAPAKPNASRRTPPRLH